jgi:hypothetical protein
MGYAGGEYADDRYFVESSNICVPQFNRRRE